MYYRQHSSNLNCQRKQLKLTSSICLESKEHRKVNINCDCLDEGSSEKTVVGDWHFDKLSFLQSPVESVYVSWWYYKSSRLKLVSQYDVQQCNFFMRHYVHCINSSFFVFSQSHVNISAIFWSLVAWSEPFDLIGFSRYWVHLCPWQFVSTCMSCSKVVVGLWVMEML